MLSRTADSLFWLSRLVERAENTARLLDAASRLSALPSHYGGETNEWESALAAAGALTAFQAHHDEATQAKVVNFLAFAEDNPSSIRNCLHTARSNARAVRTALTFEMWEAINDAWLEMKRISLRADSRSALNDFVGFVKQASLRFDGCAYRTMLRNDAYFFSRLGVYLERADATARLLDVKYHVLLPETERIGGGLDYFQWSSILRSVSALTSYHWVYRESLKPWLIAEFLILRQEMPRSFASCYANITAFLDDLSGQYGRQGSSQRRARKTFARLKNSDMSEVFQHGLHEFVTDFIHENNEVGNAITAQYLV